MAVRSFMRCFELRRPGVPGGTPPAIALPDWARRGRPWQATEVKPRTGAGGAVVHGCCAAPRCRDGTAAPSAPISARLDRRSATARLVGPGGAAAAVAQELSVGGLVVSFFLRRVRDRGLGAGVGSPILRRSIGRQPL